MVQNDEGLTKTYNRFHDPDERSNAIGELRRLHDAMDRAVLDAYGWPTSARPAASSSNGRTTRTRPTAAPPPEEAWRYRWPEEIRDEVLARLLTLNKERAAEEKAERKARRAAESTIPAAATIPALAEQRRRPRLLVETLRRDLIGPMPEDADLARELLPLPPSSWYLAGYLVSVFAPSKVKARDAEEEMDDGADGAGADEVAPPERTARRSFCRPPAA